MSWILRLVLRVFITRKRDGVERTWIGNGEWEEIERRAESTER